MKAYALLLACAVIAAGLLGVLSARRELAAAPALATRHPLVARHVPPYPGARFFALGDELHVDGWTRRMAYALTPDAPRKVIDRYEAQWRSQGLDVRRARDQLVSATGDGWLRTIVAAQAAPFFLEQRGQTVVFASVTQAEDLLGEATRLPLPRGCEVDESAGQRDLGGALEVLQATCELPAHEVEQFYDAALGGLDKAMGSSSYIEYNGERMSARLLMQTASVTPPRTRVSLAWEETR